MGHKEMKRAKQCERSVSFKAVWAYGQCVCVCVRKPWCHDDLPVSAYQTWPLHYDTACNNITHFASFQYGHRLSKRTTCPPKCPHMLSICASALQSGPSVFVNIPQDSSLCARAVFHFSTCSTTSSTPSSFLHIFSCASSISFSYLCTTGVNLATLLPVSVDHTS